MPNHSYKTLTIGVLAAEGVSALTLNASEKVLDDHHKHHDDFDVEHILKEYRSVGDSYNPDLYHFDHSFLDPYDGYSPLEFDTYIVDLDDDSYLSENQHGYYLDIPDILNSYYATGDYHYDPHEYYDELFGGLIDDDYLADFDFDYYDYYDYDPAKYALKDDLVLNDGHYKFPGQDWSDYDSPIVDSGLEYWKRYNYYNPGWHNSWLPPEEGYQGYSDDESSDSDSSYPDKDSHLSFSTSDGTFMSDSDGEAGEEK